MARKKIGQRRLRKYRPDPKGYAELYGGFRITERDREILRLIHRYRFVTIEHIEALIEGSNQQLARRLQGMFHNPDSAEKTGGYVTRYLPMRRLRVELDFKGSEKLIHGIDTNGWREIEADFADDPSTWRKDYTRRREWFIEHGIEVSNFHAALEVAVKRDPGLELVEWRQDNDLADKVTTRNPETGESEVRGLRPDAYFGVLEKGRRRNFFLEIDRGTEEHAKLQRKFQSYYDYLRSQRYRARYEGRAPDDVRVLVVTTPATKKTRLRHEREPRSRLERMLETLTKITARRKSLGQFWFSSLDAYDITKVERILGPIWRRVPLKGGPDQRHQLF